MASFLSTIRRVYLTLYNWIVFAGWAQVLYFAVKTLKETGHENVYDAVEKPLQLAQTAAVLEIIRYSFFGLKEALGFAPSWHLWLRYSSFLVLYPTGITSEVGLIYLPLPHIKTSEMYSVRMPNTLNFSFDFFYATILVLAIYVPGTASFDLFLRSPHMYRYMLGQRKRALSKSKKE
uniref:Very-long-chain (3R)-3-hydroxyacyl-CoA dehydratase n=1 Tax=Brassica campestris TaxID=3711 RepID=M4CXT2_BRACM